MSRRRLLAVAAVAVAAVLVIGLVQALQDSGGGDDEPALSLAEQQALLEGAPAELAALHAQAAQLLPGDRTTVRAKLAELQAAGRPVVINKWAAWCGPCRLEFPVFQRVGAEMGKQVAFLGLDSDDNAEAARKFLREKPVSYPSYEDRNTRIAQDLEAGRSWPTTIFIDKSGRRTVHQGPYDSAAELEQAVRRYALGTGA